MSGELELLKALNALKKKDEESFAEKFTPYDAQLNFLNSTKGSICLFGGNRVGKSQVGSYAVMCHATGEYPSWWKGIRYAGPIEIWVVGVTSIRVRDTIQQKLFGRLGKMGTGMIPKSKIVESSLIKKTGTPMAIDRIEIKHASGGTSVIQFFSYEMEQEKFMGSSVNLVWLDEEPPKDIYEECKMRVLDTSGTILFTFTPLSGTTPLIEDIMADPNIEKIWLTMDDAKHLKKDDIDRLLEGMSESDKKARRMGIAGTGEGKIFNFQESDYIIDPFEIPPYWRRIGGLDVGLTHPTGALCAAIDDDADTIYIYKQYRVQNKTAFEHAANLKHWGVKFLIDPSAFNRQIGTGQSTAAIYQDEGLDLIKANNSVDASIIEIRRLIGSGRLFIFSNLDMLLKELRMYRTKKTSEGNVKIVKEEDDLIDPLRYICMGISEHAERPKRFQRPPEIIRFKAADKKVGY